MRASLMHAVQSICTYLKQTGLFCGAVLHRFLLTKNSSHTIRTVEESLYIPCSDEIGFYKNNKQ